MVSLPGSSAALPAAVQRPLLQGRQSVAGLWFPTHGADETRLARRVLAHWRAGAVVLRFSGGYLLRYAAAQEQHCEALDGWPLRLQGQTFCSAPLTQDEIATTPVADVWLVLGAQVMGLNFSDAQVRDTSLWLDIENIALHDTFDCRAALPKAVEMVQAAGARDLREVLNGQIGAASGEQQEFLRALSRPDFSGRAAPANGATQGLAHAMNAGAGLFQLLKGLFSSGAGPSAGPGEGHAPSLPQRAAANARPQAWRRWLAHLAMTSQVSRLLGQRQAAYMRKTLELFESGRLDEALRHAIPLGDGSKSLGQAFGVPGARTSLDMNRGPGAVASIQLGQDLDAYLRHLYRQSFEKLDRENRIDEACFVLAELLNARQEALDYLEKHQRYRQAAELALAWDSPCDVIVRLFCLANDWRQALAVARRDRAFSGAVLQLEKRWPDVAARLREEWAASLAVGGDWLGAVEAIWPVVSRRALAVEWLLSAEAAGGRLGARALVRRAMLLPDTLRDCAERLEALRDDPACNGERAAVVQALLGLKDVSAQARQLARIVLPASLGDLARGDGQVPAAELQRLMKMAADPWLQADLPALTDASLPAAASQELRLAKMPLNVQIPEPGGLVILDAVALDDGRHLVAVGEAGALIVDLQGRVLARFAVPAERIVIAHSAQVALVAAQRGQVSRVSRLDLARRRSVDLGLAELAYTATEFDGVSWTVGFGSCLRVLDTQQSLQEVLWQVADLPGLVQDLSVNENVEQIVIRDEVGALELWRYALPARRLLARGEAVPDAMEKTCLRLLNPTGGVIDIAMVHSDQGAVSISYRLHTQIFQVGTALKLSAPPTEMSGLVGHSWLFLSLAGDEKHHFLIISLSDGRVRTRFDWPSAARPQMRITSGYCTVYDSQGRVWSIDTRSSAMRSVSVF